MFGEALNALMQTKWSNLLREFQHKIQGGLDVGPKEERRAKTQPGAGKLP